MKPILSLLHRRVASITVITLFALSGCTSLQPSRSELDRFAFENVYLDPGSSVNLIQYYVWRRTFPGKRGSPIVLTIDQSEWMILKNMGGPEYAPPLPPVHQYHVRIIVDITGHQHVINESAGISSDNSSGRRVAEEQVARRLLLKVYRMALESGAIKAMSSNASPPVLP
jgi:hypothetical protein